MDHTRFVCDTWDALARGDLDTLLRSLAPEAKWRAVEDGPWNCDNRDMILDVMSRNLDNGLSGNVEDVVDIGDRVVVAFRPDRHTPGAWPLDHGIRYMVLTMRDDLVVEMKGCANRATEMEYAAS